MDDDDQKYPSQLAERFQVRLPVGLRDRIKAYAERHGRSMNTEIVRILEREFPEPWTVGRRVGDLLEMLTTLKAGASDERINRLVDEIEATVEGIYSGRVRGLDDETRRSINYQFERWKEREMEDARDFSDLDGEEEQALGRTGRTEKFTDPFEPD